MSRGPKLVHTTIVALAGLFTAMSIPAAANNWSTEPPPKEWSAEAYDPDSAEPSFGNQFSGGPNDVYDSHSDPHHPLKNPDKDPGPQWEREDGKAKKDRSPGAHATQVDWDWGERYFEQKFSVVLNIKNHCSSPQTVSIFTTDLRALSFPSQVTVPPGKQGLNVKGQVTLPSAPIPSGLPGEPAVGWVDLDPGYIPPGVPPPQLHQPNFVSISGSLVTWHPWSPDAGGENCLPARTTYVVGGHMHWRPPSAEDEDSGPSQLARTNPCVVYWNTGERPPRAAGSDCTPKIRQLARHFIDKVLPHYRSNASKEWAWMIDFGDVGEKSVAQLLAMKKRADAIMGD